MMLSVVKSTISELEPGTSLVGESSLKLLESKQLRYQIKWLHSQLQLTKLMVVSEYNGLLLMMDSNKLQTTLLKSKILSRYGIHKLNIVVVLIYLQHTV
jgi:hypothetical protein